MVRHRIVRGTCASLLSFVSVAGARSSSEQDLGFSQNQLPVPPGLVRHLGMASPDGRELSFVDPTTGDIGALDVMTGRSTVVAAASCSPIPGEERPLRPSAVWSADGRLLACGWSNPDGSHEIRSVDRQDGHHTVLARYGNAAFISPLAWSQNGQFLAIALTPVDGGGAPVGAGLGIVDRSGGLSVLRRFEHGAPTSAAFSPDGRHLAYEVPDQDLFGRLSLTSADEGWTTDVGVLDAPNQRLIGWLADGRLVMAANRDGHQMDLWSLVVTSRVTSQARRVLTNVGFAVSALGIAADGTVFVRRVANTRSVYTAEIDPVSGRAVTEPQRIAGGLEPVWSPDGSRLAWIQGAVGAPDALVVRSMASGEMRRFELGVWNPDHLHWLPDGSAITMDGIGHDGASGTYRLDLANGESRPYRDAVVFAVAADGRHTYEGRGQRRNPGIAKYRLEDGHTEMVTTEPAFGVKLSPDGRWLAYFTRQQPPGSLVVVSAAGGAPRVLLANIDFGYDRLTWSADSRHVYFQQPPIGVQRVSVDGGSPVPAGITTIGFGTSLDAGRILTELDIGADGRQLVLDFTERSRDAWGWKGLFD